MQTKKPAITLAVASIGMAFITACSVIEKKKNAPPQKGSGRGFNAPPAEAGDGEYAPIMDTSTPVGMGYGVDLRNQKGIPNKCVDGNVDSIPQQDGFFSLDATFKREEILEVLGGSIGGGVSLPIWGASAKASFSKAISTSNNSLEYFVYVSNKDHSEVFVPTGRTEASKNLSKEEWLSDCGGAYVAAKDYGSSLMIKFSLTLRGKGIKQDAGGEASGNYLSFASLKASISKHMENSNNSGYLSVTAYQTGGKPAELGKILKKEGSDAGLIESFALCDGKDLKGCMAGLRSIEDYISNVFPKQMEDKTNGGSSVLRTYPFKYPVNIGGGFNPGLAVYVENARNNLAILYKDEMQDLAVLVDPRRTPSDELDAIISKAKANVSAIRSATQLCFETATYPECATNSEELTISCSETIIPDEIISGGSDDE
jgi:hypothetical protein